MSRREGSCCIAAPGLVVQRVDVRSALLTVIARPRSNSTIAIEWHEEKLNAPIIEDLAEWRRQVDALDNPIHTAFYRFILFTGFRKAEALTLRWRDVHADHIHLPMTKNGRAFDLPIS